jgi:hypothetical protein
MSTAKHLKDSNLQPLRKRRFLFCIKNYIPAILFSSLLGTYLDLLFVGKHLYFFPIRPFPSVFSINILFTLVGLPILMVIYLKLMQKWRNWARATLVVFISLGMTVIEKKVEEFGFFVHSNHWSHLYTFIGYCLFLLLVYTFHKWLKKENS